ncbi:MAG: hypothetical protein GEV11_04750 [Streptosporangiales bacterium]|nr:hypothetical protein [Streptosporangiales bacterium]
MLPYAAYLRVYEPLAAYPEPERGAWAAYASAPERALEAGTLAQEHTDALLRLIAVPPIVAPAREDRRAYVRHAANQLYICPCETRLRSWQQFQRFAAGTPAGLMDAFVPPAVAEEILAAFTAWQQCGGAMVTHIRTSTWHIPAAWFAPFDVAERRLVLHGEPVPVEDQPAGKHAAPPAAAPSAAPIAEATRTLVYLTSMVQARRRVARAVAVIRRSLGDGDVLADIDDLGRWIEEFHPHSLVELDYGGLVHLLDDAALQADQSVAEVAAALTGLETGQEELTMAMYKRLTGRWKSVQARESAN